MPYKKRKSNSRGYKRTKSRSSTASKTPYRIKYYKPLSKEEAEYAKKHNMTPDEFRYNQACSWAITMGEDIPTKKEYMEALKRKRLEIKKQLASLND